MNDLKDYDNYKKYDIRTIWRKRKKTISDACGYDCDEYRRWVEPISFAMVIGSRIFLEAEDYIIEDEHVSEAIKLATALEIHEETSKLYAVELIPKEDSEFICHMLRQLYALEHDLLAYVHGKGMKDEQI